ncbi:MAG: hypothetical protein AVDCRST_MAG77-4338, partial [uncultured Chloroflexi bacterium]
AAFTVFRRLHSRRVFLRSIISIPAVPARFALPCGRDYKGLQPATKTRLSRPTRAPSVAPEHAPHRHDRMARSPIHASVCQGSQI